MDGELAREHHPRTPGESDFARIVASMVSRTLANPGTVGRTISHSPAATERATRCASPTPGADDQWPLVAAAG